VIATPSASSRGPDAAGPASLAPGKAPAPVGAGVLLAPGKSTESKGSAERAGSAEEAAGAEEAEGRASDAA
jgi:hypothetical protein